MSISPDKSGVSGGGPTISPTNVESAAPVAPAELGVDERDQSSLSQSSQTPLVIEFVASLPQPGIGTGSGLYSSLSNAVAAEHLVKAGSAIMKSYNETVNSILDSWNKQIAEDAQAAQEDANHRAIQDDALKYQRDQQGVNKDKIESDTVKDSYTKDTGNFMAYWESASPAQKSQFSDSFGEQSIKTYLSGATDPVEQNASVQKMIPVISALFVTEMMDVNPLATDITMRPVDKTDSSATPDILASPPGALQDIPQVNMMLPIPMFINAAEASLSVFERNKGVQGKGSKQDIDEQFVNEFAKKTLERTNNMGGLIADKNPQYGMLPENQKSAVDNGASLVALTTVLIFDVKSQAQFSNLSPEEFGSLLKNGVPGNDLLTQVTQAINNGLASITNMDQRVDFVSFLLDYMDRARTSTVKDLKNFSSALLYATAEIGSNVRTVNVPD